MVPAAAGGRMGGGRRSGMPNKEPEELLYQVHQELPDANHEAWLPGGTGITHGHKYLRDWPWLLVPRAATPPSRPGSPSSSVV
jgi:hypothetical protein